MSLIWAKVVNGYGDPVGFIEVNGHDLRRNIAIKIDWVHKVYSDRAIVKNEVILTVPLDATREWGLKVKWKQRQRLERAGILRKKPSHE